MSNRTAQANKAVEEAWRRERELVAQGLGTRDWTVEEQESILNEGKAYDAQCKAYQGHHMKSVERYPEYQGDAENIQFLSLSEHRSAHHGSFRNATNGYYNPVTGTTKDFGDNIYEQCEIIQLSAPLIKPPEPKIETDCKQEKSLQEKPRVETSSSNGQPSRTASSGGFGQWLKNTVTDIGNAAKKVGHFCYENRSEIIPCALDVASNFLPLIIDGIANKKNNSNSSYNRTGAKSENKLKTMRTNPGSSFDNTMSSGINSLRNHATEQSHRTPARQHDVRGYTRIQNGKAVHVSSYKRGRLNNMGMVDN